jgi:DNA-binding beta-propeller fold protein YncE
MRFLHFALLAGLSLSGIRSAAAVELYWSDQRGIHQLRDDSDARSLIYETFDTRGIATDVPANRLFWSDVLPLGAPIPGGVIRAGGERGGEFNTVVNRLPNPAGVALDPKTGNIYWTDLGDTLEPSAIYMARRDGSNVRPVVRGDWLAEIEGIAVDPLHGKLYFTYVNPLIDALYSGGIGRADLDGANLEGIVSGLGKPFGVAVDPAGGEIFWADARKLSPGGGEGTISVANLDGMNQRMILGGLDTPHGVALDLAARQVYWADTGTGKIQRTSMSGVLPYLEDVVVDLKEPRALAIANAASTPLPGDANNDGFADRADAAIVAGNFGLSGPNVTWSDGDFNADSRVSLADLAILQAHWSGTAFATSTAVSEPSSILGTAALAMCVCALCLRRFTLAGGEVAN